MCDRVGILVKGELVQITTVEELVEGMQQKTQRYRYHVDHAGKAAELLKEENGCTVENTDSEHFELEIRLTGESLQEKLGAVNRMLFQNGVTLFTVSPTETQRLEDAFIELTKGDTQIA